MTGVLDIATTICACPQATGHSNLFLWIGESKPDIPLRILPEANIEYAVSA